MKLVSPELLPPCPYCGGKSIQQGKPAGCAENCAMGLLIAAVGILTLGIGFVLIFFTNSIFGRVPYCNDCRKRITQASYLRRLKEIRRRV